MTEQRYDVVIIGGGPAGTRTASGTSHRGLSTLLLEKREEVGHPVRCAEAIGPAGIVKQLLELDDSWICSRVHGVSIVSPSGRSYTKEMKEVGYVLDRHLFDSELASKAASSGAEIRTGQQVTGLRTEGRTVTGVDVVDLSSGRKYTVSCRLTVGADGVESLSPRWAGLRKASRPSAMFSCAQYTVSGIDLPGDFAEFHLGRSLAPGGYAWVFPKGGSRANVGVGLDPSRTGGRHAASFLEHFLESRCPGAARERFVAGGTLTGPSLRAMATGGYLCVGEAASQNNPFTGGGILESLCAADIAAGVIGNAFDRGDLSEDFLGRYDSIWKKKGGKANDRFHKASSIFYALEDEDLDRLLESLSRDRKLITSGGLNPLRLLKVLLFSVPGVTLRAAALAIGRPGGR